MKVLILVLITIGVFLDTFSLMISQGSLMPKIKIKTILTYVGIFSLWQIIAVLAGNILVKYHLLVFIRQTIIRNHVFSAALILVLGGFVIAKALDRTKFLETRMDKIDFKNVNYLALISSFDTFLVSFSMTISNINVNVLLVFALVNTIISIVLGLYFGYVYGYEIKYKMRYLSACILFISGFEIII